MGDETAVSRNHLYSALGGIARRDNICSSPNLYEATKTLGGGCKSGGVESQIISSVCVSASDEPDPREGGLEVEMSGAISLGT